MKLNILKTIMMCIILTSCDSNTSLSDNTTILAITNTIMTINDETGESYYNCNKYINDSNVFQYKNELDEWIDFDCSTFGIDYNSLIVGDALIISHNGTARTQTMLPSKTYISGLINKVEVKYTDIYEVVLHKDKDNNIRFSHLDSSIDIEIAFDYYYESNLCITQIDNKLSVKSLSEYKDGTILYYAYNPILPNPKAYTWLYDYKPR